MTDTSDDAWTVQAVVTGPSSRDTNAEVEGAHEKAKRGPGRPPGGPGGPGRTPVKLPDDQWAPIARDLTSLTNKRDGHQDSLNKAQDALDHSVYAAHTAGASWAQIAEALGVTRQSVYRRYVTGKPTIDEK